MRLDKSQNEPTYGQHAASEKCAHAAKRLSPSVRSYCCGAARAGHSLWVQESGDVGSFQCECPEFSTGTQLLRQMAPVENLWQVTQMEKLHQTIRLRFTVDFLAEVTRL
jgi:hypothetical protein